MNSRMTAAFVLLLCLICFSACSRIPGKEPYVSSENQKTSSIQEADKSSETIKKEPNNNVTAGSSEYRGFSVDYVLHSDTLGNIHFNLYIPDSYDGNTPYAIYFTMPGYQGLYFQGVAENIKTESFGFEAQQYNEKMIIVAPQLEDWGEISANKTLELVQYFLNSYNIDDEKVYISGYSGGGETVSLVMAKQPELFTACLMCSSRWDGSFNAVIKSHTPIYFVIGESDEYYSAEPFREAYNTLHNLYMQQGLNESEISELLVLDIKPADYFSAEGVSNQHEQGGVLFAADEGIMGWMFES